MTETTARRRYEALGRMTVARGCTREEAATAARLRAELRRAHPSCATGARRPPAVAQDANRRRRAWSEGRWEARVREAAARFAWEYRTCGKRRCHCMHGGARHGPYRYAKRRRGRTVRSLYLGLL